MYRGIFDQRRPDAPGCRPADGGFSFGVWAPNALAVSLVGDFNGWDGEACPMARGRDGIWRVFVPGLADGALYKYRIVSPSGEILFRADPCGRYAELRPGTASAVWRGTRRPPRRLRADRARPGRDARPLSIYEVHAGSWREDARDWQSLADGLARHAVEFGFTHVELMPVCEFPFDGSWGYQTTGYFAPTSRWGDPDGFRALVDTLHAAGVGVILDWVPAHFPRDEAGLRLFDGTPLFEPADPARAEHPLWGTLRFGFESEHVRDFLISSALWWLGEYRVDGLRVDAVSAILYDDMSAPSPETRNPAGETFLRELNETVAREFPKALMIAEESSSYPGVTAPAREGGLGFTYKWNMGWMNDSLRYMQTDPLFRSGVHGLLTFPMVYAFSESFILPLSHDECVHGKKSFLDKMAGDYQTKFDSFRSYLTYFYTVPGKKLLFMGTEFGPFLEWRYYEPLEWQMTGFPLHGKLYGFVRTLTRFYRRHPALFADDRSWDGFCWSNADDAIFDVYSYFRRGGGETLLVVFNTTPVPRPAYLLGAPEGGTFRLVLNSDDEAFGGGGAPVRRTARAVPARQGGFSHQLTLDLPPAAALIYRLVSPRRTAGTCRDGSNQKGRTV